ncbi:helix-turn-helix domain-containing protein [Actinokineospora soli]|uniref:Helix-turn-helix domain-containing protein n=1 Tax=Actinokineospora soli TaxID=1048753 RepID=A0ABW2TP86_9PSEU
MRETTELTVGQRIEHMRRRRGMSRKTLASLLGYSDEWLRQVERKGRPVERVSTLMRLVDILQIRDASALFGVAVPVQRGHERVDGGMAAVREALLRRRVPGVVAGVREPLTRAELDAAWSRWFDSKRRYTAVREALPGMLDRLDLVPDDVEGGPCGRTPTD